ncbi:hypothetical protein [Pseudarthrobacter sp. MDT1-22]
MKNKLVFVSGIAVGYVLGTRAGRDSYEKLKLKVRGFREGPTHRDKVSDTARNTPEVQEQASQAGKKTKEEITGAPAHDTTRPKDGAASGTPKRDHPKAYAPPESDFYGIGGPASHESLDADTAQQAHRDETGGHNRTD